MDTEKRTILEIFLTFGVILLSIITYFFSAMYSQQKKLRQFEEEKVRVEIDATNEVRKKIATEIHNDVAPHLTAIFYEVHQLDNEFSKKKENILESLSASINKLRTLTKEISPLHYYGITFQEAIEAYIKNHHFDADLDIQIDISDEDILNEQRKEVLFRIFQEIILNTVKHSKADNLEIIMKNKAGNLIIKTADNGIGFDSKAHIHAKNRNGYGLMSILSRVYYLGGSFEHDLSGSKGTRYIISIPV